jgi:hypothetical protein
MIYVGGRHLCSIEGTELRRTFDGKRELFRGGLCFRVDVLALAYRAGAELVVATERTTGVVYSLPLLAYRHSGWSYDHPIFGRQLGVYLARFHRMEPRRPGGQMTLFEMMNRG